MQPAIVHDKHPDAARAIRAWQDLLTERTRMHPDWEDLAALVRPQRGGFGLDRLRDRRHLKPLSSAAPIACQNFSAAMYGTLTNPASEWMSLSVGDDDLNRWGPMVAWRQTVSRIVLNSFQPSVSSFYSQAQPLYADLATFGNAAQYDEVEAGSRRILDVTLSLAEIVADIDAYGQVMEVVRRFFLKPAPAVLRFGARNLPPKIVELAEKGSQDLIAFLHHVGRRQDFRKGGIGGRGKRWFSRHVVEAEGWLISDRGYDEMPFHLARWEVESGHTWGTGPGHIALASVRTHNRMTEATLRAAQRAADPTLLAPDRDAFPLRGQFRPGHMVYGGVSPRGEPMVLPMTSTGQIGLTLEEKAGVVREFEDAFYKSILHLHARTGLSPMEVAQNEAERTRLWAPNMGRVQDEYLAPKIARRFRMLWRAGQIPPPPEVGNQVGEVPLQVEYLSAAAMARRADERMRIVQLAHDLAPLAQVDPRYMDRFSPDDVTEALHLSLGAPHQILRSREDADKLAAARAEAQQAQQMMAMAQQGAAAARDLGQGMSAMGGEGQA